jgi:hypothetical protein
MEELLKIAKELGYEFINPNSGLEVSICKSEKAVLAKISY